MQLNRTETQLNGELHLNFQFVDRFYFVVGKVNGERIQSKSILVSESNH